MSRVDRKMLLLTRFSGEEMTTKPHQLLEILLWELAQARLVVMFKETRRTPPTVESI